MPHFFLHARHARHPADKNHLVYFLPCKAGITKARLAGSDHLSNQVLDKRLELGTCQFRSEVLRAIRVRADEWKIDLCFCRVR